ncbi:MAG TPA: protein kinase [Clostridia bacterium]|nr:protein kinase [Clostridia bacterium]
MGNKLYGRYIRNFDVNLLDCELLGAGNNGTIYLLPEGKVIKICKSIKTCKKEYNILRKIRKNKHFPRVYGMEGNYMIRDYIDGIPLDQYLRQHGLDRGLALRLIELLEEFKRLKFKKLDIRCKDIMVRPDRSLMAIDPKKFYTKDRSFPRHLSKGLYRLGVLDTFMEVVRHERPKLYKKWENDIREYIREKKKEYEYK